MPVWWCADSVTGNSTTYYWAGLVNTGKAVEAEIWLVVNGNVTVLSSAALTNTPAGTFGGTVLFQLDGSWLNLSVNGALATSTDDGTLTNGRHRHAGKRRRDDDQL